MARDLLTAKPSVILNPTFSASCMSRASSRLPLARAATEVL
jgi:hypothetical protein